MRKLTLKEFWQNKVPIKEFYVSKDRSEIFQSGKTFKNSELRRALLEDVELQHLLAQNETLATIAHRKNPEEKCSMGYYPYYCEKSMASELCEKMLGLFDMVAYIKDADNNMFAGLDLIHPKPETISTFRELLQEEKIDELSTHFLPLDAMTPEYEESGVYLFEAKYADERITKKMKESDFYGFLKKQIMYSRQANFLVNGFSPEKLEEDPYIQAFLELGQEVAVLVYAGDEVLDVLIMDSLMAHETSSCI